MARVYISSTYRDLHEHRRIVALTLLRQEHTTRALEQYFASEERPLDKCLDDIAQCDLYVGIFAWRYGFVPEHDDGKALSITEREFREAVRLGIPTLLFLSDDNPHAWPLADSELTNMGRLRKELSETGTPYYFTNPDRLATEVSVAVSGWLRKPRLKTYMEALLDETHELPLLPNGVKNLSLAEIVPPYVSVPFGCHGKEQSLCPLVNMVQEEHVFFLVGDAGQGKSTALQYLASHYARNWLDRNAHPTSDCNDDLVPIRVDLAQTLRSLSSRAWESMQRPGFYCSVELFEHWLKTQRFLFLFDRLDESDPRTRIEECRLFLRRAPHARAIIATRPLTIVERDDWPRRVLEPLTSEALEDFLLRLTSPSTGPAVTIKLDSNQLQDVFRRPLFARLLALSVDRLNDGKEIGLTRLFYTVVLNGFLEHWESQGSFLNSQIVTAYLAYCGYKLLDLKEYALPKKDAVEYAVIALAKLNIIADRTAVDELLQRVVTHGLMKEVEGSFRFWHSSFRDFFAAFWMARYATSVPVYRLSQYPEWHDCLVFYFGLVEEKRAVRQLRRLIGWLRIDIFLMRQLSTFIVADRLFLILRCLSECSNADALASSVIALLPKSLDKLYLSEAKVPASWSRQFDTQSTAHRYLLYLIGQLHVPAALVYLQNVVCSLDELVPAVMHGADAETVSRLVTALAGNSRGEMLGTHGRETICEWILNSADPRYRKEIQRTLEDGSVGGGRAELLRVINFWLSFNDSMTIKAGLARQWEDTLISLALNDEVKEVRVFAVKLLNRISGEHFGLSPEAEKLFMAALLDPNSERRLRAWNAVQFSSFEGYEALRWALLADSELVIVFGVLFNFYLHGVRREKVCRAVLTVIRRMTAADAALRKAAADETALILKERLPCAYPRVTGLLLATAQHGEINGLRLYANKALAVCLQPWMVVRLVLQILLEPWSESKCALFDNAVTLLGKDAAPLVKMLLSDEDVRVRGHVASTCFQNKHCPEWMPQIYESLVAMLNDPDKGPQGYAMMTLKEEKLLDHDWLPYKGAPGPGELRMP